MINRSEKEKEDASSSIDRRITETLLKQRRVFLAGGVDSKSAERLIRQFWFLDADQPGEPILFVIHSPGGSVDAGLAIWDQIALLRSPVTTLISGVAASMGSILSLSGQRGRRLATPNARIMIHQPSIGECVQGQVTDLEILTDEMMKTRERLVQMYVDATGKKEEEIETSLDRDTWMSVEEALEFGLLDHVVTTSEDPLLAPFMSLKRD